MSEAVGEGKRAGRRRGTPRQLAYRRIGDWPDGVGRPGTLARRHAWTVWVTARSGVMARVPGLWRHVGGDRQAFLGQVDLALLGTLAGHLRRCEDCWKEWGDQVPAGLLSEAVGRRPAGDVLRPLLKEIRAQGPGR